MRKRLTRISLLVLYIGFISTPLWASTRASSRNNFKRHQVLADFRVANTYSDPDGSIVALKLLHIHTGAPVFVLRSETVPQALTWIETPDKSNKGLPHALEHLLDSKGAKGRYFKLLTDMRLGRSYAATSLDFNYYGFASGSGLGGFYELFHAWLDALYNPDFSDAEAEREFYHFGVAVDPNTKTKTLVEEGTVYDEMQTGQGSYSYYFDMNRRVLGDQNPFAFYSSGNPEEMRGVTVEEIRRFHAEHYRLGPKTGFIFALDPKEDLLAFLKQISTELRPYSHFALARPPINSLPKYPISPSLDNEIKLFQFAADNETGPGEVRFSWKVVKTDSPLELKLTQLLLRALALGERSLLYKSIVDSKTRIVDSGATSVESEPLLDNSPYFPVWSIGISGIPGQRISIDLIDHIRQAVMNTMADIAEYPDGSDSLRQFNDLVLSYSKPWRRSERVQSKNTPDFGARGAEPYWKDYFMSLEMDSSFNRSISEEGVWQGVEHELKSTRNIWRELIHKFRLRDIPFAAGSAPSRQLLVELEKKKEDRIRNKTLELIERYHTNDAQEAYARFAQDESAKDQEINQIETRVRRPHFTNKPPLTLDDDIRYKEFRLPGNVPAIAVLFDRPATLDVGLSFDVHAIPTKYYKYLPLLPRCFDSLGLKEDQQITPYADVLAQIRANIYNLSVNYEFDAVSHKADLTFRAYGTNVEEFRGGLDLLRRIIQSNYLDPGNINRLRDIVEQRISQDDSFTRQSEENWISNPAYSFLHQDDPLFLALNSQFTWAHWDWRLKWLLHPQVTPAEINDLHTFAGQTISTMSSETGVTLSQKLDALKVMGLAKELVEYWQRSLSSFPESEQIKGLAQLASEVADDLSAGPQKTIEELKDLQRMVINRRALHVDLTISQSALETLNPDLSRFLQSLPSTPIAGDIRPAKGNTPNSFVLARLKERYGAAAITFPLYVGLVNEDQITGDVIFYSDFPGYSMLDRKSLVQVLSSNLVSGLGPQSLHMKASESGLTYNSSLTSDPSKHFIWYYADRVPDIPALIGAVNSAVSKIPELRDVHILDYALRQTFPTPRSLSTFSQRGWALARDMRTGNSPTKVRQFYEAMIDLRQEPNLPSELKLEGPPSISGVILDRKYEKYQQKNKSIFFFFGSAKILTDTEKRLSLPALLRLWPCDYWLQ